MKEFKIVNKKAYHLYNVIEEINCGIVLLGSEVKSIRLGNVNLTDCFAYIKDREVFIRNMTVGRYKQVYATLAHDENREKKILLKRREIDKITRMLIDKGTTMVPLEIFISNNRIKVKIGVVKGKKLWNHKEDIKKRDIERDTKRELNNFKN